MRGLQYLLLLATITFYTTVFLLDIWSTSLFLKSPNCVEANPLFSPFSNSPVLLAQIYVMRWFFVIGPTGYIYLLGKRTNPIIQLFWYWLPWVLGFQHLFAVQHNLSVLGLCWA